MSDTEVIQDSSQPQALMTKNIPNLSKYMNFIGILAIIGGALYCITIIGAIFGIPSIFIGIRMREAAEGFKRYLVSDSKEDISFAIDRQTKAFYIQFVLAIILLAFLGLYLIIFIIALSSGAFF